MDPQVCRLCMARIRGGGHADVDDNPTCIEIVEKTLGIEVKMHLNFPVVVCRVCTSFLKAVQEYKQLITDSQCEFESIQTELGEEHISTTTYFVQEPQTETVHDHTYVTDDVPDEPESEKGEQEESQDQFEDFMEVYEGGQMEEYRLQTKPPAKELSHTTAKIPRVSQKEFPVPEPQPEIEESLSERVKIDELEEIEEIISEGEEDDEYQQEDIQQEMPIILNTMAVGENDKLSCGHCRRRMRSLLGLQQHMNQWELNGFCGRGYSCPKKHCPLKFDNPEELKSHVKTHSRTLMPRCCTICGVPRITNWPRHFRSQRHQLMLKNQSINS